MARCEAEEMIKARKRISPGTNQYTPRSTRHDEGTKGESAAIVAEKAGVRKAKSMFSEMYLSDTSLERSTGTSLEHVVEVHVSRQVPL